MLILDKRFKGYYDLPCIRWYQSNQRIYIDKDESTFFLSKEGKWLRHEEYYNSGCSGDCKTWREIIGMIKKSLGKHVNYRITSEIERKKSDKTI